MFSSRWFRRLWAVQELCLGRQVGVLCGHCFLPWDSLTVLSWKVWNVTSAWHDSLDFQALNTCRRSFGSSDVLSTLTLMDGLGRRSVTKPIDRVYGLILMLPKALRDSIEVDYSKEKEYWSIYVKLAYLLLLQPGGLLVLSFAPGKTRPVLLPSWCPNWNGQWFDSGSDFGIPKALDKSNGCGGPLRPLKAPNIRNVNGLQHIMLYGFRIDRIACTVPFQGSVVGWGRRYAREWNFWQQRCLRHLEEMTKSDTPHVSILSTHLRNLRMGIWTHGEKELGCLGLKMISADDMPEINRCYEELISSSAVSANPSNTVPAETPKDDYLTPGAEKFLSIGALKYDWRPYLFTEQGRVGRGCPGDWAGDILIALYTAPELFVLRYEDGSDVARLIGEAYLDGCVDLDTMPSEGRGPDEWFTLG